MWSLGVWFCWIVPVGIQVPFAYLYSLIAHATLLSERVRDQEARLQDIPAWPSEPHPTDRISIPNHTLLRRIGEGAYGEVWLGRNAVGLHVAVKVVERDRFTSDAPYEREFRGIQKYMPISMSHPGLLQILHVGREDARGYFFYIMELGDDETVGPQIDPDRYAAKTLASEIRRQGL